jgi:hypothetical protein
LLCKKKVLQYPLIFLQSYNTFLTLQGDAMPELLNKAFIDELTDEEEALLNRLEQEWLARCAMLEAAEWQDPKPIIKATSLN